MAKKKEPEPKVPVTAEPPKKTTRKAGTRPVRLDLEPEEHTMLRIAAAKADTSMASLAREILVQSLRERERKA